MHLLRVEQSLQQKIQSGIVDVYLPNDTHWGVEGHKTMAQALVEYLLLNRIITYRNAGEFFASSNDQIKTSANDQDLL